ncbi:MAG TPA: hypothetical protein VFX17_04470 [Patescibacteria group bacterium]|nr:hypothetical protein [Patescibacteria group bacterium]
MTIQEKITRLLDSSVLFTAEQKDEWSKLVPQMDGTETMELYDILADEVRELKKGGINLIDDDKLEAELLGEQVLEHGTNLSQLRAAVDPNANANLQANLNQEFARELKSEINTPELTSPQVSEPPLEILKMAPKPKVASEPVLTMAKNPPPQERHTSVTSGLKALADIKSVDDLKKVQTEHLRQGELLSQIGMIRDKIVKLAQINRILPYYTVAAFEESPLYKTYLRIGANMIADSSPDRAAAFAQASKSVSETLTMREFEAVADLRKQIEQL